MLAVAGCPGSNTSQTTGDSSSSDVDPTTSADSSGTSATMTGTPTTSADSGDTSTTQEPTTSGSGETSSDGDTSGTDTSSGETTESTSTTGETSNDCGNGVIDDDEDCDGDAIVQTCAGLGFLGGTLGCTDVCGFDIAECLIFACGNGVCDSAEDSCNCGQDCADDPNACSSCECGEPPDGGCGCDEDCFEAGNCCDNICDPDAACGELLFGCTVCGDGVCGIGEDSCNCEADCPDDPNSCSPCDCGTPAGGGHCGCDEGCFDAGNCCADVCDLQACQVALENCPDQGMVVFEFSGAPEEFLVPAFITEVHIEVWGAEGGTTLAALQGCGGDTDFGGMGGYAEGDLSVMPGESLFVFVGGIGGDGNTPGFNGGGTSCPEVSTCSSGGGASDVRRGGQDVDDRVIVAGGGGGAEYSCGGLGGGGGGGLSGDPGSGGDDPAADGQGGTQIAGGVAGFGGTDGGFGVGGNGSADMIGHSGGGGGGYWGGGGGGIDGSAGGGSSYIDGVDNGITIPDQRLGNGTVIISWGG